VKYCDVFYTDFFIKSCARLCCTFCRLLRIANIFSRRLCVKKARFLARQYFERERNSFAKVKQPRNIVIKFFCWSIDTRNLIVTHREWICRLLSTRKKETSVEKDFSWTERAFQWACEDNNFPCTSRKHYCAVCHLRNRR